MGRAHGVDEVSCAHSGQKPAWLISRNSSISFEPTFTEYAAEIAPFFTLISLVWNRKNTHVSTSSLATMTLFPVPATKHGHILFYSHCSSTLRHTRVSPPGQDTSGFHLQKNTPWSFMVCPPKESVPHMSRGMSLTGTVPSCVSFSPSSSSSSLLSDSSLEEE